jgi:hypothetical protein
MIASSFEPRLRDIVDAIGYIRSDLDKVTLESFAGEMLDEVCREELAALPPNS